MLGPALMLNLDILGLRLLAPAGRGDELAGFYQAAVILPRIPVFTARSLLTVLFSYAAGTTAGTTAGAHSVAATKRTVPGNSEKSSEDYGLAALRLWQRLLLPAGLALALAPEAALRIFFPETYLAAAGALRVAALGGLLLSLVTLLAGVAQAGGQRRMPALAAAAGAGAQVVVLAWLVPHWGPMAAATSLVAAGAVSLLVLSARGALPIARAKARVQRQLAPRALFQVLTPYVLLALPLLLLPGATRSGALLQYVLAGVFYLVTLVAHRPAPKQIETSTPRRLFHDVVTLLIGG
jgi:hypothetical protein